MFLIGGFMIHSILIIGQSNMAGRGKACEVEPIVNDKLYVLRNGRWRAMYVPVNPDRVKSGINLVEPLRIVTPRIKTLTSVLSLAPTVGLVWISGPRAASCLTTQFFRQSLRSVPLPLLPYCGIRGKAIATLHAILCMRKSLR